MGYRFHYRLQGQPLTDLNCQPPIVLFLHGFLGSGEDFDAAIESLSDLFCCLTIDLPGHGQTIVMGTDRQYEMAQTAAAIINLLDRLQIPQCFLVGYSMGGRLALYLGLNFPQRFPNVVLESASPGLESDRDRQTRLQRDWDLADRLEADFPAFLEQWYGQPLFQPLRRHLQFAEIQTRRSRNQPVELAKSLRYLSTGLQPSLWQLLEHHSQPLLLVVGADDRKFCEVNQAMVDRCSVARLAIVPDCGHAPHLEQPEEFVQQVRSFFSEFS